MNLRVLVEEHQHAMAIISHINGHHQSQRMSTAAHTFATSHSTWRNLRVANNGPCLSQTHAVSCSTLATPCLSQTHAVSCSTLATHCLSQTHAVSCSTLATPCLPQTHTVSCSMLATHCLSQTHAVSFSTLATSQGPCLSLKNTSKWFLSATRIVHRCTRCVSQPWQNLGTLVCHRIVHLCTCCVSRISRFSRGAPANMRDVTFRCRSP